MAKSPKKMTKAEAGRKGGRMTKKRHGVQHYRTIGKKGFMTTVARHWQGDKAGYIRYLQSLGVWAEWERGFARLEPGESGIVCKEIPPIPGDDDEEDDGPPEWRAPFDELWNRIIGVSSITAVGGA